MNHSSHSYLYVRRLTDPADRGVLKIPYNESLFDDNLFVLYDYDFGGIILPKHTPLTGNWISKDDTIQLQIYKMYFDNEWVVFNADSELFANTAKYIYDYDNNVPYAYDRSMYHENYDNKKGAYYEINTREIRCLVDKN